MIACQHRSTAHPIARTPLIGQDKPEFFGGGNSAMCASTYVRLRLVLFWAMSLFIDIQVIFASFFLSMLGISRGTYIGDYDLK